MVTVAITCKLQVGDKIAGRHGNKGIVSAILEERDMPYLPDGTPVDIVLNPLGVPSRMNVGQIFECLLGNAGRWTNQEYRVAPFDEAFADEASRGMVFDALKKARDETGYEWLFDPRSPGKTRIYDGRTGEPFLEPVTVGVTYILKLYHMVRDKIAMRSWGGYSSATQQPVKGRARQGGMRLGEMEVSALVGYGARHTLQEMITVKSDDMDGRMDARRAMMKGMKVELPLGATPEGYLLFRREIGAAGFQIEEGAVLKGGGVDAANPGDWLCKACNQYNYASRLSCFRCETRKEEGLGAANDADEEDYEPSPAAQSAGRSQVEASEEFGSAEEAADGEENQLKEPELENDAAEDNEADGERSQGEQESELELDFDPEDYGEEDDE